MLTDQRAGWILDELGHAGRDQADPTYANGSAARPPADPTPDIELLRDMGLDTRSTLVELGAGSSCLALAVAPLCRRVVAVDASGQVVSRLSAAATGAGRANLECVRGGFLSYEHSGPEADFVYTRNSLHHLPDFWKAVALRRIAAILRPGGVLRLRDLVFSFEPGQVQDRVGAWFDAGAGPLEGWARDERERHLRDEYSTFSWLLEPMLERSGFDILEASYSDSGIHAAYTCARL